MVEKHTFLVAKPHFGGKNNHIPQPTSQYFAGKKIETKHSTMVRFCCPQVCVGGAGVVGLCPKKALGS